MRLAAYVRVSSEKQTTERQMANIEEGRVRFLPDETIAHWYDDSKGKNSRHMAKMEGRRLAFKQLLADVEAGKWDRVIVDQIDRWGTENGIELLTLVQQLERADVSLMESNGKVWTTTNLADLIMLLLKGEQSREEQDKLSYRVTGGKRTRAIAGEYQGGNPPYGLDVVCFAADGTEKWRSVYNGHYQRTRIWPDGRIEEFNGKGNCPTKDPTDTLRLRPSIRDGRVEAVIQIYQWFTTENVSPMVIAKRLDVAGVEHVFGKQWSKHSVKSILSNPVYTGYFVWNKVGKGTFNEYSEGSVKPVPKDKRGKNRRRKESDHVRSARQEFDPIVSQETFAEAQAKLAKRSLTAGGRATVNSAGLWLRSMVWCQNCGTRMTGVGREGDKVHKPHFCCSTYARYGKKNPKNCGSFRVNHEKIEKVIRVWLEWAHPQVVKMLADLDVAGDIKQNGPLKRKLIEISELRSTKASLQCSMMEAAEEAGESYESLVAQATKMLSGEIKEKEEEFDQIFNSMLKCTNDRARAKADEMMNKIEAEINALKARIHDMRQPVDALTTELEGLEQSYREAAAFLSTDAGARQKTAALESVIDKVYLSFEKTPKGGQHKLASVTIMPLLGDPNTLRIENTRIEAPLHRSIVSNLLERTFSPAELAQLVGPIGTPRKGMRIDREKQREIGRKAAAARLQRVLETGRVNRLSAEERSQAARRASQARWAKRKKQD